MPASNVAQTSCQSTLERLMSNPSRPRLLRVLVAVAVGAVSLSVPAQAAPGKGAPTYDLGGGQGHVEYREYGKDDGILFSSLTYLPSGWTKGERLPVYVMIHGCGTTAAQQMGANLLNPIADRERFIVLYPDNQGGCFRAVSDDALAEPATGSGNSNRGTGGDVDIIAGMTKQTLSRYHADADRVYMIGMSAGAFQASHTAVAYPELYAAVGVAAGGGPGMAVTCLGHNRASVPAYAQTGLEKMGSRAHVMPFFTIGGTEDQLGEYPNVTGCARLAYLEWLFINNTLKPSKDALGAPGVSSQLMPEEAAVVNGGQQRDTFETNTKFTKTGQVPDGHGWTSYSARDAAGCEIGQRWIVDGMGHYWSGGSTDPKYTDEQPTPTGGTAPGFNDPKGPSASQASWDFFKQFSLKTGNTACTSR